MSDMLSVAKREWINFLRSDRSVFAVYAILVLVWSIVLASNLGSLTPETGMLWWIFFSVIVSGNISNTTFVAERISGSLEIILTCGISRRAILAGKMLYVVFMSAGLGLMCLGLGLLWIRIFGDETLIAFAAFNIGHVLAVYISACFMNAACGAWLSTRLPNPRLSHLANLLVLGLIVGIFTAVASMVNVSQWVLVLVLASFALLFYALAARDFNGEKVVQPFTY